MISEIDIQHMKEICDRIDTDYLANGKESPFTMEEYFKIMDTCDALIKERQSKIARLFLPLVKWG